MTRTQWNSDEERQTLFRNLINEPVMQEALSLIRALGLPQTRRAEDPQHITNLYALDYAKATGWYDALSALESLQETPNRLKQNNSQPWDHKKTETNTL